MLTEKILNKLILKTDRFYLRPLLKSDVSSRYLSWMNDVIIKKYIVSANKKNNIETLKQFVNEKINKSDCLFLGIFSNENDLHIGNIKYEPINFDDGIATMGIMIGDVNWRGKNVFSEVLLTSSKWLKSEFNISNIQLGVEEDNINAIRAYKKLGFIESKKLPDVDLDPNALKMNLNIDAIKSF